MAPPSVRPSALLNDVGTPVAIISQLNTRPACAPVNASMAASRLTMHDSGSGWIATPFLCDSCIHDSTPVYPGALSILLEPSHDGPDEAFRCTTERGSQRNQLLDGHAALTILAPLYGHQMPSEAFGKSFLR
jgi:hypothetical protein